MREEEFGFIEETQKKRQRVKVTSLSCKLGKGRKRGSEHWAGQAKKSKQRQQWQTDSAPKMTPRAVNRFPHTSILDPLSSSSFQLIKVKRVYLPWNGFNRYRFTYIQTESVHGAFVHDAYPLAASVSQKTKRDTYSTVVIVKQGAWQ